MKIFLVIAAALATSVQYVILGFLVAQDERSAKHSLKKKEILLMLIPCYLPLLVIADFVTKYYNYFKRLN